METKWLAVVMAAMFFSLAIAEVVQSNSRARCVESMTAAGKTSDEIKEVCKKG